MYQMTLNQKYQIIYGTQKIKNFKFLLNCFHSRLNLARFYYLKNAAKQSDEYSVQGTRHLKNV